MGIDAEIAAEDDRAQTGGPGAVAAPANWVNRRIRTTVLATVGAVVSLLLLQWLVQPIAGGLVGAAAAGLIGAAVGINGLAGLTGTAPEVWSGLLVASTFVITIVAAVICGSRTYIGFTWESKNPEWYGMSWWRNCWAPVLIGTGVHAALFAVAVLTVLGAE